MTQKDVVDRSAGAISPGHLGMVESGQRLPGADMLDALAAAMDLPPNVAADLHAMRRTARASRKPDPVEVVAADDVDLADGPDLDDVLRKVQEAMDAMEQFKRAHERKERR